MNERVDVVFGGPGREAAVSRLSGAAIVDGLRAAGCDVAAVPVGDRIDPAALRDDAVVFNIVHGTYGEDGSAQDDLAAAGRVYVGSDARASRLCMDKEGCKQVLAGAGLPVPWGRVIDPTRPVDPRDLRPPSLAGFVLKPRRDGSSVGLRAIANLGFLLPTLEELVVELGPVPLLLEERLPGPEYTVAVLEDADGTPRALPPIRIVPASENYDYRAKYHSDDTRYEILAPDAVPALGAYALRAYAACGCRDFARIDLMADRAGEPRILEVNTLPGFTAHSLVPKAAAAAGIDFPALCHRLVALAGRRRT